jgi:hypothetical protein
VYVRIAAAVVLLTAAAAEWPMGVRGAWIGVTPAPEALVGAFLPRRRT